MCLAVPGQVLQVADDPLRTAAVSFGGVTKTVSLALVPDATVGDYVIVHVGFAISKLNEDEAGRTLEAYAAMAAMEEKDRAAGHQPATGGEGAKSR
ncbi:MAG: HypC/HybG/HupF family hydrogenase formation chaperone [Nitrospira sp.]|nr:HypC/HybG/HupF family hydrogenase formation chaperone [Nitrospira sp.]